ncbi:hypothetical protein GSI_09068 [Ganoderma sinense ZZ0214-1]|uniref:Transporter n=1 Tax=Ganoderma sinense ZZ0214-1 TaxID=1077348 RepID=A0A2G8S5H1_9APHY|nr:hypothetical protein GSI_09068 [Ganoderma sinense ZZ0214-1]
MLLHRLNALLALVTASCIGNGLHVLAAPQPHLQVRQSSGENGGQDNNPTTIQKQIWIPLVVVAALFVVGTIFACCGRRFRRTALFSVGGGVAQASGVATGTAVPGIRELTADQLVNNGNGNGNNATTGANGGTNRARRPRRTRRTPSQISTHSLPAYMKEPGEEEIVIVRGADELHDDIPITVEMPPVDEHGNESPRGSFEVSAPSSMYAPVPHTPHDMPLLHNHDHEQHLSPDRPGLVTRPSFDSGVSSGEDGPGHYPDAAPAYETVVLDDPPPTATSPTTRQRDATSPTNERASSDQQAGTGSVRRRSVFASIFNPRNSRLGLPTITSAPPIPLVPQPASPEPRSSTGHSREDSRPSLSSERDPRRSRILRHQPSHSGSGSMFSLLSRTRSNGNLSISGAEALTSPSMISLHSISNPLTHTLVKTEFTYPKNGPTPDQVRLISSRESFARFGRPYGADAIAFAASSSRINLEPPPGFEEVAGGSGTGAEGEGGRGSPSSGSQDEEADTSAANTSSSSAPAETQEAAPTISTHVLTGVQEVESPVVMDQLDNAIAPAPSPSPSTTDVAPAAGPVSPTPPAVENISRATSSSPEPVPLVLSPPVASLSSEPAAPAQASNDTTLPSPPVAASSKAPPSAFKGTLATTPTDNSFPARAASRASSFMSFATAEESPHTPGPYESQFDLNDDAYESAVETPVNLTAPSTPRMEPRHLHEGTDTTITPGR